MLRVTPIERGVVYRLDGNVKTRIVATGSYSDREEAIEASMSPFFETLEELTRNKKISFRENLPGNICYVQLSSGKEFLLQREISGPDEDGGYNMSVSYNYREEDSGNKILVDSGEGEIRSFPLFGAKENQRVAKK